MRRAALVLAVVLLGVSVVDAQRSLWRKIRPPKPSTVENAFYVRTDGSNSNDGKSNTAGGAWLTMDYAADNVTAGAVIRVQAGTYGERVSPAVSGSSGSPITLVAEGAVTFCGMDISSDNYLRVIGFTIDTDAGGCMKANRAIAVSGTNTGNEFWHNTIRDANQVGIGSGSYADRNHNTIVIGNTFTAIGPGGAAIGIRGNHNVIAYNDVDGVDPDAFIVDGTYSYWLNNYIHNVVDSLDGHSDIFQANASSLGLQFNVFEGNLAVGNGALANEHGTLLQNQSDVSCSTGSCADLTENLFRRNVWHNQSGGAWSADSSAMGAITNSRLVHESFIAVMRNSAATAYGYLGRSSATLRIHNALNYQAWGDTATSNVQVFFVDTGASITTADYNLAYDPDGSVTFTTPWTSQANELSNIDPALTNVAGDDFTIGSGSGARNAGGPLTTTSGSGTGTTFNVASGGGGFFRGPNTNITTYGGQLTAGDVITVGTDTVTVASVSGDAVTVTGSFTWADAEPVYFGSDTTPDIGAYPYNAGGYSLTATYSIAGSTVTVSPSDASLVRFAICFEGGIPTTVDNSSPYTCARTNGLTLAVRVYPRYASATRWATATP